MFKNAPTAKRISIDEPCSQNWNEMPPVAGGRHCDSCCKTVIDFTSMSNEQIIAMLTVKGNLCGQLESWQISSINQQLQLPEKSWFNRKGIAMAASLLFAVASSYGQSKPKAKKLYHKQILIKAERLRTDTLITYYTGYKPLASLLELLEFPPDKPVLPTMEILLSGKLIGGFNISNNTPNNEPPAGYFKNVEDMLQATQH